MNTQPNFFVIGCALILAAVLSGGAANANDFVDLSFVQAVQSSGLIKQLYGR